MNVTASTISEPPTRADSESSNAHTPDKALSRGSFIDHLPDGALRRLKSDVHAGGFEKGAPGDTKNMEPHSKANSHEPSPEVRGPSEHVSEKETHNRGGKDDRNILPLPAFILSGQISFSLVPGRELRGPMVGGQSSETQGDTPSPLSLPSQGKNNGEAFLQASSLIEGTKSASPSFLNVGKEAKDVLTMNADKGVNVVPAMNTDEENDVELPEEMETEISAEDARMVVGKYISNRTDNSQSGIEPTGNNQREPSAIHVPERGASEGLKGEVGKSPGEVGSDTKSLFSEVVTRPTLNGETSPVTAALAEGEEVRNSKNNRDGQLSETGEDPGGVYAPFQKMDGPETPKVVHQKAEAPQTNPVSRETFVITKKNDTSIEVSFEPRGIGKLKMHLSLGGNVVHARIDASEIAGRELIDRNLMNILNALSDEGIHVGSFSVHLGDKRKELGDPEKGLKVLSNTTDGISLPVHYAGNSIVNIFV